MDKLTVEQAGALGGKKRWKGFTKKERSARMSEVALARWASKKKKSVSLIKTN